MSTSMFILLVVSSLEILLLFLVLFFFIRLKRSENILQAMQEKQSQLLKKLHFNTELEQELVSTFEERQADLAAINKQLEERSAELRALIAKAEEIGSSPKYLREIILSGKRQGKSTRDLARATGLSPDEVELIIDQAETV